MAVFDVKSFNPSEPFSLYSDLKMHVSMGESYATSELTMDDGQYYLLGGLDVSNLNEAGLSEETIGRLTNALDAANIKYALFPGDQRNGYLPLILDKKARAYIKTELNEILENQYIHWYIFKLPTDIDPDDNERSGSEIVRNKEDGEKMTIAYNDIATYLHKHGVVEDNNDDDEAFLDDAEVGAVSNTNQKDELKDDNDEFENDLALNSIAKNHEYQEEEEDTVDTSDVPSENDATEDDDEDDEFNKLFGDDASDNAMDGNSETIAENEDFTTENDIELNDASEDPLDINDDYLEDEHIEDTDNPLDANGDTLIDDSGKQYEKIPETLQKVLDSIRLPRIKHLPEDDLYTNVRDFVNNKVDEYNEEILNEENQIKTKILRDYQNRMNHSYDEIKNQMDVYSGNTFIKESYRKMLDEQERIDDELKSKIDEEKHRLDADFRGPKFEAYKEAILANLYQKFEDEKYGEYVDIPLETYREEHEEKANDKKAHIESEWYMWKEDLETTARTKDQKHAVIDVSNQIERLMDERRPLIDKFRQELSKMHNQGVAKEMQRRANEYASAQMKEEMAKQLADASYKQKENELEKERQSLRIGEQQSNSKIQELESQIRVLRDEKERSQLRHEDDIAYYKNRYQSLQNEKPNMNSEQALSQVAQQPTQVVASPVMGEQQQTNHYTEQQMQKLNDELKKQQQQLDKEKKNSRIKGWMMTGGGLIGGIILSVGLYLGVAAPDHDQAPANNKPQTQQQTNVQSGGGSKANNKAKLPADSYEKGDVIKNVKTPDGKTGDLVVDDLKKNDNTLLVHKKADSDKELDYNKEKDHYDFYSVPVEGFDKK